jgi:hypothetical protein
LKFRTPSPDQPTEKLTLTPTSPSPSKLRQDQSKERERDNPRGNSFTLIASKLKEYFKQQDRYDNTDDSIDFDEEGLLSERTHSEPDNILSPLQAFHYFVKFMKYTDSLHSLNRV